MKNIDDLINDLSKERDELKSGTLEPHVAAELNNNAGKLINAAKLNFEYESFKKGKDGAYVRFLEVPSGKTS